MKFSQESDLVFDCGKCNIWYHWLTLPAAPSQVMESKLTQPRSTLSPRYYPQLNFSSFKVSWAWSISCKPLWHMLYSTVLPKKLMKMKKKNTFTWAINQDLHWFKTFMAMGFQQPTYLLQPFNTITVQADASGKGLSAWLLQEGQPHCICVQVPNRCWCQIYKLYIGVTHSGICILVIPPIPPKLGIYARKQPQTNERPDLCTP